MRAELKRIVKEIRILITAQPAQGIQLKRPRESRARKTWPVQRSECPAQSPRRVTAAANTAANSREDSSVEVFIVR